MNKKLILLPISIFTIFMMAGLVSASPSSGVTCTFDQTATTVGTRSTYIDTSAFNLSVTTSGHANSSDNASVMVLTNDITSTEYVSNTTFGDNLTQLSNISVDTTEILDTQTVTYTATIKNEDQETVTTCTRAYVPDNTDPTCNFASGLIGSADYPPTQKWTVTCTNAGTANIKFGNNPNLAMTEAGDVCTFTGSKATVPEGSYTVNVVTSDGLNTTGCSLIGVKIDVGVPLKQIGALVATGAFPKEAGGGGAGAGNNNALVLVVIAGAAGYWYVNRKKK
jgi:hypothetical protein